jgi:hypothetical protein
VSKPIPLPLGVWGGASSRRNAPSLGTWKVAATVHHASPPEPSLTSHVIISEQA